MCTLMNYTRFPPEKVLMFVCFLIWDCSVLYTSVATQGKEQRRLLHPSMKQRKRNILAFALLQSESCWHVVGMVSHVQTHLQIHQDALSTHSFLHVNIPQQSAL